MEKLENLRKHRDIKLVTTEGIIQYQNQIFILQSFHRKFINHGNENTEILVIEPVCLGLSLLELSKILMYEFWYDYVKPKCDEKTKLPYMDTDSFTVYIKTDDIDKGIAEDVETRFYASNYELECNFTDSPLHKGKNEKMKKRNWINER